MPRHITRCLATALLMLTLTTSCKRDPAPDPTPTAKPTPSAMFTEASMISDRASFVLTVRSLERAIKDMSAITGPEPRLLSRFDADIAALQTTFGLRLDDMSGWDKTGVDMSAPVFGVFVDLPDEPEHHGPFFMARIEDRDAFAKTISSALGRERIAHSDNALHFADMAPIHFCGDYALLSPIARPELICARGGLVENASLTSDAHYRAFTRDVMRDDATVGVYAPARNSFHMSLMKDMSRALHDNSTLDLASGLRVILAIRGLGASLRIEGDAWAARSWVGLSPEGMIAIRDLTTATPELPLSSLITRDVIAASLVRIDASRLWEGFLSLLTVKGEAEVEGAIAWLRSELGVDFEPGRDLFSGHTGNVLVAMYLNSDSQNVDDYHPIFMTTFRSEEDTDRILGLMRLVGSKVGGLHEDLYDVRPDQPVRIAHLNTQIQVGIANKRISIFRSTITPRHLAATHFDALPEDRFGAEIAKKIDGRAGGVLDASSLKEFLLANNELTELIVNTTPNQAWVRGDLTRDGFLLEGFATPSIEAKELKHLLGE